ncbi:hypothetical protein [Pseudomonas sp. OA65]|uniref:hypothetical protein n=1 Tax=Pseudomonas sp. OA65 TaxID=2818431 RepID=UPI001A9E73C6|nr:hypothetical protein [Pseudomonas sp. OA65]MBO1539937.1 hypothetical protein [Pseudomonas sp. OA65]
MDPFSSLLWDIFKNVLGNRVDALIFGKQKNEPQPGASGQTTERKEIVEAPLVKPRRFKTFDAVYDLEKLLAYVDNPIVYLLVEDSPSSAYNLPSYVLESGNTGEWFVFTRGRLALQGSGGGHQNTKGVFEILLQKKTKIGAWVVEKTLLDQLDNGQALWPEVKQLSVPLLAVLSEEYSWSEIQRQFEALSANKT